MNVGPHGGGILLCAFALVVLVAITLAVWL